MTESADQVLAYINQTVLPRIARDGWVVQAHNLSTELGGNVTYTVGLTDADLPELAIAGLPHEVAGVILNDCARTHLGVQIRAGLVYYTAGGTTVKVVDAPGVEGPLARALYGARVRFLQLLWPDPDGNFPTSPAWTPNNHPAQPVYDQALPGIAEWDGVRGVVGHMDEVALRRVNRGDA